MSEKDVRLVNDIAWPLCLSDLACRSAFDVLRRYRYPLADWLLNTAPRLRLQILTPEPVIDRRAQLSFVCLLNAQGCRREPFVLEIEVARKRLFNNVLTNIKCRICQRASCCER